MPVPPIRVTPWRRRRGTPNEDDLPLGAPQRWVWMVRVPRELGRLSVQ